MPLLQSLDPDSLRTLFPDFPFLSLLSSALWFTTLLCLLSPPFFISIPYLFMSHPFLTSHYPLLLCSFPRPYQVFFSFSHHISTANRAHNCSVGPLFPLMSEICPYPYLPRALLLSSSRSSLTSSNCPSLFVFWHLFVSLTLAIFLNSDLISSSLPFPIRFFSKSSQYLHNLSLLISLSRYYFLLSSQLLL